MNDGGPSRHQEWGQSFCHLLHRASIIGLEVRPRAMVLMLVCLVAGCARSHIVRQEQLVGYWEGAPYQSQFGTAVNTICFKADGTVESVVYTQAGRLVASGSYSLHGEDLTLSITDAVENPKSVTLRIAGTTLALVDGQDETIYERKGRECGGVEHALPPARGR